MSNSPRFTLNRTVVMLMPKEPFLQWLNDADPEEQALLTEDFRDDNNVFLIPQFIDTLDSLKWVEKRWTMLFEHMLLEWIVDETMWPQHRTLAMFREWFDVEIYTMVWDLAEDELLLEDWQDDGDGEEDAADEENERIILH